jgi:response regulator RpfG family c-di-GMP phosphodiesterase
VHAGAEIENLKVLIVDSGSEFEALRQVLQDDYPILRARNRADATWKFIENRPDIVLVNKNLGGFTGSASDAVEDILHLNASAKVVMYGRANAFEKRDELAGVEAFVPEPLTVARIVNTVRAVLGLKHAMVLVPS